MEGRRPRRGAVVVNSDRGRTSPAQNSRSNAFRHGHGRSRAGPPLYAKGRDNIQFIPSISRSGGDNGKGDTLKEQIVQDKYWAMLKDKLNAHKNTFSPGSKKDSHRQEQESNLLLHLRKLREGILASNRQDEMALSVYETSFLLAITVSSPVQASSSLSHLTTLYAALPRKAPEKLDANTIHKRAMASATVSLLFHLEEGFPSQQVYYRHVQSLKVIPLDWDCKPLQWTASLRAAIARRNYTRLRLMTDRSELQSILDSVCPMDGMDADLLRTALNTVVDRLRRRLRTVAWEVLRSAYREFSLSAGSGTSAWMSRSLILPSVDGSQGIGIEDWMKDRAQEGHCVPKDGFEGRWSVRRPG